MMFNQGKIEGIFYSEFHKEIGPKIVFQVPEDTPTQVSLDDLHMYLIPKNFYRKIIKLNYAGQTIIGFPILLTGEKYERNEIRFNCCFLFNSPTDTSNYENIVRKLNLYLEQEVIHASFDKLKLPALLKTVYEDLNNSGKCHYIGENNSTLHLQVNVRSSRKVSISNTDVPIFTGIYPDCFDVLYTSQSDIVGKKILPLINGEKPVGQIAHEGEMELDVVKHYLRTFVHHGVISLVSLFQYSNVYMTTSKILLLYLNAELQEKCLAFVSLPGKRAIFTDVFKFFSCLSCSRVDELCGRLNPRAKGIDERKLIQFGLLEGLVRKINKYPIYEKPENQEIQFYASSNTTINQSTINSASKKSFEAYLTGYNNYDDLCDITGFSHAKLDENLEALEAIICWK